MCKLQTIAAVHLLDYVLPQVAKLSKTLQTEKLEITAISGLVEYVLHSLDDAVLPSANWVLGLIDLKGEIEEATGLKLSTTDITSFQKNAVETFIKELKNNIASQFSSQNVVAAFDIFNPKVIPDPASEEFKTFGEQSIDTWINHYGTTMTAETDELMKSPIIDSETHTEWKTFRHYSSKKRDSDTKTQLKELTSHEMLVTMFPNLSALANICMSLPVSTASVERSFSQMKMIKTRLRNRIGESSLNHLMLIAIESPNEFNDNELDCIVNV